MGHVNNRNVLCLLFTVYDKFIKLSDMNKLGSLEYPMYGTNVDRQLMYICKWMKIQTCLNINLKQ